MVGNAADSPGNSRGAQGYTAERKRRRKILVVKEEGIATAPPSPTIMRGRSFADWIVVIGPMGKNMKRGEKVRAAVEREPCAIVK